MLTLVSVFTGTLLFAFDMNMIPAHTPTQTTAAAVTTGITGNLRFVSVCSTGFLDGVSIGANTTSSFTSLSAKAVVFSSAFTSAGSSVFVSITSFSSAIYKTSVSVDKKSSCLQYNHTPKSP